MNSINYNISFPLGYWQQNPFENTKRKEIDLSLNFDPFCSKPYYRSIFMSIFSIEKFYFFGKMISRFQVVCSIIPFLMQIFSAENYKAFISSLLAFGLNSMATFTNSIVSFFFFFLENEQQIFIQSVFFSLN